MQYIVSLFCHVMTCVLLSPQGVEAEAFTPPQAHNRCGPRQPEGSDSFTKSLVYHPYNSWLLQSLADRLEPKRGV